MTFGIIQRYVMAEVVRAFLMALVTMTGIFVLFMVMAEATKLGLTPRDIAVLVPYIIPSTLPFTVPVSLLFAVTVVYGRLASDNEIIAIKSAGVGAMTVLWPAYLLGAVLSGVLFYLSIDFIPSATHNAKLAIFKNFEEMFYKVLKKEREFANGGWPFQIKVADVDLETRMMYEAIFKQRKKGGAYANSFESVIEAKQAKIIFDMDKGVAHITLYQAEIAREGEKGDVYLVDKETFDLDMPDKSNTGRETKIQELSSPALNRERLEYLDKIAHERKRQAIVASFGFASGRIDGIDWSKVDKTLVDYDFWVRKTHENETEVQFRMAQSFGSLAFVLLGAVVGIRFARRDFLSAFIVCFLPIILLYYPLMLLGMNLGKEGVVDPLKALWSGNILLAALTGFTIRDVLRH